LSFVKHAMFVNINYVTNDPRICKEYLTTALKIANQFLASNIFFYKMTY